MTALRTLGLVLGLSLCGCGARTDDGAAVERSSPVSTTPPGAAQPSPPAAVSMSTQTASAAAFINPVAPPSDDSSPPLLVDPDAPDASPPKPQQPEPLQNEPPRPNPAPPPASNACFEYLGDWITCENAGWPNVEQTSATDLQSCMQLCQQRPDCTAVTEYFWMDRPDLGCWLYTSTCAAPAGGVWQEEDGGRQYRKRCATP